MMPGFPIIKHPPAEAQAPILVSIPHYGTQPLPHITATDYTEPWFETFAYGFADTFAGDLYADLHEQGATVLATPFSRIFVDVNRRREHCVRLVWEVRIHPERSEPVAAFDRQCGGMEIAPVGVEVLQIEEQAFVMHEMRPGMPGRDVQFDDAITRHPEGDDVLDARRRVVAKVPGRRDPDEPFLAAERAQALRDAPMPRDPAKAEPDMLRAPRFPDRSRSRRPGRRS